MREAFKLVGFCSIALGILFAPVSSFAQSLPLFIPNVGQFPEHVRFVAWGGRQTLWLTEDALWLLVTEDNEVEEKWLTPRFGDSPRLLENISQRAVVVKLGFYGANPCPVLEPLASLETRVNYFWGQDPTQWRTNVPAYSGVRLREVYPGIDVEIFGKEGQWTWRVRAQPWADLSRVQLEVEGVEDVAPLGLRDGAQALRMLTSLGTITVPFLQAEYLHSSIGVSQVVQKQGFRISSPFQTRGASIASNSSGGLVYIYVLRGGAFGIAVDAQGCAYVAGDTSSQDFPTTPGAYQGTLKGSSDAFVAKLNPIGSSLLYATFLGGSGYDGAKALVVDAQGCAYVVGGTSSLDFPTTPEAYQRTLKSYSDAFVVKLDPTGSSLFYATLLGGSEFDGAYGIAVDAQGCAYVAGGTSSRDFPTTPRAYQRALKGYNDAFVVKLNPTGSSLLYATLLGGTSGGEEARGIAVDAHGNAYVAGTTFSEDFPTSWGAYRTTKKPGHWDAFVAKVDSTGSSLIYATFLGGSNYDRANSIAIDAQGCAYVAGGTSSQDFPTTPGAYQRALKGSNDAFVVKLNPTGSSLLYATLLGGTSTGEEARGIAVDAHGNAYVAGNTLSEDFPTTPGSYRRIYKGAGDAFVVKLNPTGSSLLYATFLGESSRDAAFDITIDDQGNVYTTGVFSDEECFVAKLAP